MQMNYTKIPYVEHEISKIIYGTAIPQIMMGGNANQLLDEIYATGVNTFDTARGYLAAEILLGKWIEEKNMRDKIVILSKCGHPSMFGKKRVNECEIRKDFMRSSRYLHTDFIDIYLLHRDDTDIAVGEIIEILNAMHAEGKIGAFGGSNWTYQRIAAANEYAYKHNLIPFTVSSPNYCLADQVNDPWGGGCVTISGPRNKDSREWYRKNQMPVIAYSSLGRGLFSGKVKSNEIEKVGEIMDEVALKGYGCQENYERLRRCEIMANKKNCSVAQIAMAWIFNQKINTVAVVSTSSAQRMQQNIDAMCIELSEDECLYLDLGKECL